MAKKQQRFKQPVTVFEPTEAEVDAVLADVFAAMDKAEADRKADEAALWAWLESDADNRVGDIFESERAQVVEDDCPCCFSPRHSCGCDGSGCEKSERAQVVEDAIAEDEQQRQQEEQNARAAMDAFRQWRDDLTEDEQQRPASWWLDVPVPFSLTEKGLGTIYPYAAIILDARAARQEGRAL